MGLGQPDVQRQHARLGAEAEQGQAEGGAGPPAGMGLGAHAGEGVVAAAPLEHAEGQQDADGADMGYQQVEVAGAADLREAVIRGDQEERGQGHGFPGHHEEIGVVGHHDKGHAGEEQVVLQALQARRRTLARAEITCGVDGNAGAGAAQQHQEQGRQAVQAQMEGQVGQAQGQHHHLGRGAQGDEPHARQQQRHQGAQGEQQAADVGQVARGSQPGGADGQPTGGERHGGVDRQPCRSRRHGHSFQLLGNICVNIT